MSDRNLEQARRAYEVQDVELGRQAHGNANPTENNEQAALKDGVLKTHKEPHKTGGEYIKSAVYGGMDGIITTYSVVMGVLGANLPNDIVFILGIATLIADAISMALGDYLSSKSENDFYVSERQREAWEVTNNPEGEKLEMIELYKSKGIDAEDAVAIAETLSKSKDAWVDVMMVEELGLAAVNESPHKDALVTFFSFLLFGLVPLLPFIVGIIGNLTDGLFVASTILTIFILIVVGLAKSLFSNLKWYVSGAETLIVGTLAAVTAYLIGLAFEGIQ